MPRDAAVEMEDARQKVLKLHSLLKKRRFVEVEEVARSIIAGRLESDHDAALSRRLSQIARWYIATAHYRLNQERAAFSALSDSDETAKDQVYVAAFENNKLACDVQVSRLNSSPCNKVDVVQWRKKTAEVEVVANDAGGLLIFLSYRYNLGLALYRGASSRSEENVSEVFKETSTCLRRFVSARFFLHDEVDGPEHWSEDGLVDVALSRLMQCQPRLPVCLFSSYVALVVRIVLLRGAVLSVKKEQFPQARQVLVSVLTVCRSMLPDPAVRLLDPDRRTIDERWFPRTLAVAEYMLAMVEYGCGNESEALLHAKQASTTAPDFSSPAYLAGYLQAKNNLHAEAIVSLSRCSTSGRRSVQALTLCGCVYARQKEYINALRQFSAAIEEGKLLGAPVAVVAAASCYHAMGQAEVALRLLHALLEDMKSEEADDYVGVTGCGGVFGKGLILSFAAWAAWKANDGTTALSLYRQLFLDGLLSENAGRRECSVKLPAAVVPEVVLQYLHVLVSEGRTSTAKDVVCRCLAAFPGHPAVLLVAAEVHLAASPPLLADALSCLDSALESLQKPQKKRQRAGDQEQGLPLKRARHSFKHSGWSYMGAEDGDVQGASATCDDERNAHGEDGEGSGSGNSLLKAMVYNNKGFVLYCLGQEDGAVVAWRAAGDVDANAELTEPAFNIAVALIARGEHAAACRVWLRRLGVREDASSAVLHDTLASLALSLQSRPGTLLSGGVTQEQKNRLSAWVLSTWMKIRRF